jgi:hypothetical protein
MEQQITSIYANVDGGESQYRAFTLSLKRRMHHNLSFDVNYALSRSVDTSSYPQNNSTAWANPFNSKADYGFSDFDRRHMVKGYLVYELPKFSSSHLLASKLLSGWQTSEIFTAWTGLPLLVDQGYSAWAGGYYADDIGAISLVSPKTFKSKAHYGVKGSDSIGTSTSGINYFGDPATAYSDFRWVQISSDVYTGRNNPLRGFPWWNLDASLAKKTTIGEHTSLAFSLEAFNVFNNVNFSDPDTDLTSPSSFGVVSGQASASGRANGARGLQLGLRLDF